MITSHILSRHRFLCSLFHTFMFLNLCYAYYTGGSTHKFLLPFTAHDALAATGLAYWTPNPIQKYLRRIAAGARDIQAASG